MITAAYVHTMTRYNAGMNARLYAAASRLSDAERRLDRGAFWQSIHGTLSHILWADRMWMSRFAGWARPAQKLPQSAALFDDFDAMAGARAQDDAKLLAWTATLTDDWLAQDLTWTSGAAQRDFTMPRAMLLVHVFNHQTHHRGQVHAMLTAAGQTTGDTDLWLVLEDAPACLAQRSYRRLLAWQVKPPLYGRNVGVQDPFSEQTA